MNARSSTSSARPRNLHRVATVVVALASTGLACSATFALRDPPAGYAVVSEGDDFLRAKARDDVGLNIATFDNVVGGTLDYWGDELVTKLEKRTYRLTGQRAVSSRNGVAGTRFDFRYTPAGSEEVEKFYTAILFVSDEHRVVVQFAGDASKANEHAREADEVVELIKIRGCKAGTKVCKGPQPRPRPAASSTGTADDSAADAPSGGDPRAEPDAAAPTTSTAAKREAGAGEQAS